MDGDKAPPSKPSPEHRHDPDGGPMKGMGHRRLGGGFKKPCKKHPQPDQKDVDTATAVPSVGSEEDKDKLIGQ